MRILVIGSGGREHALVWKIDQSPLNPEIYCAPGNPGTEKEGAINVPIDPKDLNGLLDFAKEWEIDLTVVGPEQPLVAGIVDLFETNGLAIFGPTKKAAEIEGSKADAKELMLEHGIPTAEGKIFTAEQYKEAADHICQYHHFAPPVVKADGLAAGKGVEVSKTMAGAEAFLRKVIIEKAFGKAGDKVIIEKRLEGEEVSYLVFTDGKNFLPLATSQDHKPIGDNDEGDNTGGMGAYSPVPVVTPDVERKILYRVVRPMIDCLAKEGRPFRGVLYLGLMIDKNGDPWVLEFNCRFGDPETQPILCRMKSDIVPYLLGCAKGALPDQLIEWDERAAVCVVMAAKGYPGAPKRWKIITGFQYLPPGIKIFHAGTTLLRQQLVTNGGRVLSVTGMGTDIRDAIGLTYEGVHQISWPEAQYRNDIGKKALNYLK